MISDGQTDSEVQNVSYHYRVCSRRDCHGGRQPFNLKYPPHDSGQTQILSITSSDSAKKLFCAPNNVGIATCGPADIGGVPIAGFVESFIVERLKGQSLSAEQVANELKVYFGALGVRPGTVFHVAGYAQVDEALDQTLFLVDPPPGCCHG